MIKKQQMKIRLTNVFCYMKVMPIPADRKYILQVNCIYNTNLNGEQRQHRVQML